MRLDAPEAHQLIERDAESIAGRAQVFFDEAAVEAVVTGRHRRVRGEARVLRHFAKRFVERHAIVFHHLTNDFERSERTVTFVQVIHARRDAERLERLDAADAKDDFLANARALVAAVQAARQLAVLGAVAFDVAVEQV